MLRVIGERICATPAVRVGAFGLAYFAGAELGHLLSFKDQGQAFATFWPPSGLFLAALVLSGLRLWPALLLAAFVANLASDVLRHDKSVPVSLGFCVANSLEACLGAWLLRRFVGTPLRLTRLKDVLGLACLSALLSPMCGATVGAGVVTVAFGGDSYWSAWQTWWVTDALGVLVFAPVVLSWTGPRDTWFNEVRPWRIAEGVVLFAGMILVAQGVYGEWLPAPLAVPIFILPFLLWVGLRFGPRSAAAAILAVAIIGVWNTSQGRGPYTVLSAQLSQQVLRAQGTLGVISLSVLLLAAAAAERRSAEQERAALIAKLQRALDEIKTLRGFIPICAWCKKIRDDSGFWQDLENYLHTHTEAEFSHCICPDCLAKQFAVLHKQGADEKER
jgi:integral membrane sensor domain MASE1